MNKARTNDHDNLSLDNIANAKDTFPIRNLEKSEFVNILYRVNS